MGTYDVVIAGDVYCDLVFTGLDRIPRLGEERFARDFEMVPGGVFITAAALRRLGLEVGICCWLGDDPFSRFVLGCFADEGLSTALVQRMPGPLPTLTVALSLPADRAFLTYRAPRPCPDPAAVIARTTFRHMHVPSLAVLFDHPDLVDLARGRGAGVSLDCQSYPEQWAREEVAARVRAARPDVFLPNRDEALSLTGADTPSAALDALAAWAPTVITLGGDGALAAWDGRQLAQPALPIDAVDTTGAGDAFDAGFIYGLLQGAAFPECVRIATICGGLSTTARGGATAAPTLTTVQEWLARGW